MFELKFDAANRELAAAMGAALTAYGRRETVVISPAAPSAVETTVVKTVGEVSVSETERKEFDAEVTAGVETAGKPADTATGPDTSTETPTLDPAAAGNPQVDPKGVPFNALHCGKSEKPFYASGKTKDQWKKRKGADQAAYDNWYAGELAKLPAVGGPDTQTPAEQPVNTADAFNKQQDTTTEQAPAPTDAGTFMQWIAEQQTAGLLAQTDIDGAYNLTGVNVADLFNPATAPEAVAKVYGVLSQHVRQQG